MNIFKTTLIACCLCMFCSCQEDELKTAQIQNSTGLELYYKGNYKKARYFFQKAADHLNLPDSNKAEFFDNIAHSYSKTNQPDSEKIFYRKACKLYSPASINFKIGTANLFLADLKVDSAKKMLQDVYETDSSNGVANNLLGMIYIGDYGQDYFDPEKAYKFNNRAFVYFKDAASKFALAKNEYFIYHMDKSIALFSQLHCENPKIEVYLGSLILIKGETGDQSNLNVLLSEFKRRFPGKYDKVVSEIQSGKHNLRWNL